MSKVIVYENEAGGVSVCYPSGELPIEEVKDKDCPADSLIIDSSLLPEDHTYFNAWRLVDGAVVVNIEAAKELATITLNNWARQEYLSRAADEAIGLQLAVGGEDFAAIIEQGRQQIASATSTSQMSATVVDTEEKAKTAPLE